MPPLLGAPPLGAPLLGAPLLGASRRPARAPIPVAVGHAGSASDRAVSMRRAGGTSAEGADKTAKRGITPVQTFARPGAGSDKLPISGTQAQEHQPGMSDPREDEILRIVAKETGVDRDRLLPDARLSDIGVPSLDLVQAIFAIESHFDIELPLVQDRVGAEFDTVGELVGHVVDTMDKARAPS